MASFVFVRGIDERDSAAAWRKTAHKTPSSWLKASRAVKAVYRRGPYGIECYKLPNGRHVEAALRTETSIQEDRAEEKALRTLLRRWGDKRATSRSRERAFSKYLEQRSARPKTGPSRRTNTKRTLG